MTSTTSLPASFMYIDCDIPDGQTLVEWRQARDATRRAERHARRSFRLPRLRQRR